MVKLAVLVVLIGACHTFQDPNVVVDLRVLAMKATLPQQVIDIDLNNPQPEVVKDEMAPSTVCALVADPNFDRRLRWTMTVCPFGDGERCEDPAFVVGSGLADDPDTTEPEPQICATVFPDDHLMQVLMQALADDSLHGLQGLDYELQLRIGGEDADPSLDLFASRTLELAARIPPERTPNNNPTLLEIDDIPTGADQAKLPLGRCVDQGDPMVVGPQQKVVFAPMEADGARETYVIPTLDGGAETFTESLTYQWTATAGGFSDGTTGGPRDPFGNPSPTFTTWTAPKASSLDGPTDVSLWVVQRDERYGVAWYESCVRVVP